MVTLPSRLHSNVLEVNDFVFEFSQFVLTDFVVVDLRLIPAVNYT